SVRDRPIARPRALWATSLTNASAAPTNNGPRATLGSRSLPGAGTPSPTPAAPIVQAPPRSSRVLLAVGLTGLVALGAAVALSIFARDRHAAPAVAAATTSTLQVTSDPPGAHLLLDGDPTGLVTPATINGLRAGRTIELRLDKPGYALVNER